MSKKAIVKSGKRKTAIAKATVKEGVGKVLINRVHVELYEPRFYRLRLQEPLMLAEDIMNKIDIDVTVRGGGPMGQADATRLAIARAIVEHSPKMKQVFLNYDRQLLVADVRFKEQHKPNRHGAARSKKQKSYR